MRINLVRRALLCLIYIPAAWYWLLITHESGHALAALITGATFDTNIPLLGFSHTDTQGGHELFIVWAGLLTGAFIPTAVWLTMRLDKRESGLVALWAAICLIANGAYLISNVGDALELQRLGTADAWRWGIGAMLIAGAIPMLRVARLPSDETSAPALTLAAASGLAIALIM